MYISVHCEVMRLWEQLVSLAALSIIAGGAAFAYNREHLSRMDLNPAFQEINQQYFDGQLSGVRVEWSRLDQESGETRKFAEHEYEILIDRRENTSLVE